MTILLRGGDTESMIDLKKLKSELHELAVLGNLLNSVAAELKQASKELNEVKTRVEAQERSTLVLQDGIFEHINRIDKMIDEEESRL